MNKEQEIFLQWKEHCRIIQEKTSINPKENPKVKLARIQRAKKDYDFFVDYYFPHITENVRSGEHIKSAKFHIEAANEILKNRDLTNVYLWARGHAKSTHMDVIIPMWLKIQEGRQLTVMIIASKSENAANKLLGDLQAEFISNKRYISDFGDQFSFGNWAEGEFTTKDNCFFIAIGRGQSPRGIKNRALRPDYIILDDIDDDEIVQNEKRVGKAVDWCIEALGGTMDMWRGRFIVCNNLIHKNGIVAQISKRDGWLVHQVNVFDKNGEPSWKEKYSMEDIRKAEVKMGYRRFQKEYMNNPITEGAVFKANWIKYKSILTFDQYDAIIAYCDPSFKESKTADYKAITVWGKIGLELHCLKAFVRQTSVGEMVRWFYNLHEDFPASVICDYYIEANFLQDIFLDEFYTEGKKRGYMLPIRPDKRVKPNKFMRIETISPLWERGLVYYNEALKKDPDMIALIEQTLAFEKDSNANDDGPDSAEGAIYLLQKRTRISHEESKIGRRIFKNLW